ncbi:hypothetical protein ACXYX3_22335 [Mycobacterium sp. C3-094]|uniref:hypothetical protein n=1 Tax=Mycobacterium sp. PSTR-4-N TaxID=2917745 RepID=UPI001F1534C0|nr:hypothetical protein [Mycobacterium sp. PSTR-4-N]MCG7593341.1 hypothetical protein [Mycobacterium sp. PSTR-4-N]
MILDWYDRRILAFVVSQPSDRPLPEQECRSWFGISPGAVMRRFGAVVDVYSSAHPPLTRDDQDLLDRAAARRTSLAGV